MKVVNAATKQTILKAVLLALLVPLAAGAEEQKAAPQAAPKPMPMASGEAEGDESGLRVMTGAEVPSYFVIAAFLRRAQILMEKPLEQRPDLFQTYGCAPGDSRFEKCAELIKKAAEVYARKIDDAKKPLERQAELDLKGKETGRIYGQLLALIGRQPGEAAAFHQWVEEVRATVGVGLSDEPGNNLLDSARVFDQELAAAYPAYKTLPGFVPAPAKKAS